MDYLDKEVIPDFLGGECVVSVAAGRGVGLQRSTEAGVGPHPCECGCRYLERSCFLFLVAGLVFIAAPKRGESSPKEGPYLGFSNIVIQMEVSGSAETRPVKGLSWYSPFSMLLGSSQSLPADFAPSAAGRGDSQPSGLAPRSWCTQRDLFLTRSSTEW